MSFELSPYETSSPPTRVYQPSELLDEILLASVVGVGPNIAQSLLQTFGSAGETLRASLSDLLSVPHVGKNLAQLIRNARKTVNPEEIAQFCEKNNISVLTQRDSRYPARLRTLDAPPQLLYVRGSLLEKDMRAIAVVGTRGVTEYGTRHAKRIVSNLAENGFTIISGLALGVDGIAHRVALDVGGRTIAVLGTGVANIYPKEHEDLAARIINSGALVSEYYPTTKPFRGNFPARNRIISALAIGVLVVESGPKGGSMITARFALEQGRDLFAIPGPIDSKQSQGCHNLIREGAILVESANDIYNALPSYATNVGIIPPKSSDDELAVEGALGATRAELNSIARRSVPKRQSHVKKSGGKTDEASEGRSLLPSAPSQPLPPLSEMERALYDKIGQEPIPLDELVRLTNQPTSTVLGLVTALEFKGLVRRCAGAAVARW